jgi:hypothetical protein
MELSKDSLPVRMINSHRGEGGAEEDGEGERGG